MEGKLDFDAAIQAQIDKNGHFIISEQSVQAIAEAVVRKIAAAKSQHSVMEGTQ